MGCDTCRLDRRLCGGHDGGVHKCGGHDGGVHKCGGQDRGHDRSIRKSGILSYLNAEPGVATAQAPAQYSTGSCGSGCEGICIQYDTRSCCGRRCAACEVEGAGLCNRKHLLKTSYSNIRENDGGDYRNLMGEFFRRKNKDGGYDDEIHYKLTLYAKKANIGMSAVRRYAIDATDRNLLSGWQDYTLDDLLIMFPRTNRRPVRIEIQLLIYLYFNFRYPVDIEHAEARFLLSRNILNNYLHAYFGYTYSSLLSKIRNGRSKSLLCIPALMIGEIGEYVGYKSLSHYSMIFKRHEGMTPKNYRQLALNCVRNTGILVKPITGILAKQYAGITAKQHSGASVKPYAGLLVKTRTGVLVKPRTNLLTKSQTGLLAKSQTGLLTKKQTGSMVYKNTGEMA